MFGTLAGALAGRKVAFAPDTFRALVTAEMTGQDYFARIRRIVVDYDLAVPPTQVAAAERALRVHTRGCAAHRLFAHRIPIAWRARLRCGDETILLTEEPQSA